MNPAGANKWIVHGLASTAGTRLPVEVRLRVELGRIAVILRDARAARALGQEAWMLARAIGSDEAAARCLLGTTRLLDQSPVCLEDFRASLDEARRAGDSALECEAAAWLINALHLFGDTGDAAARAEWMVGRTQALHLQGWEAIFRFLRARLDIVRHSACDHARFLSSMTLSTARHSDASRRGGWPSRPCVGLRGPRNRGSCPADTVDQQATRSLGAPRPDPRTG